MKPSRPTGQRYRQKERAAHGRLFSLPTSKPWFRNAWIHQNRRRLNAPHPLCVERSHRLLLTTPARASVRRAARTRFFLELPLLEHPGAVQAAVREICQVLADNNVFFRPAMRLLYALQFATREKDESGRGATSSRPLSPPSIRIARGSRVKARTYSHRKRQKGMPPGAKQGLCA